MSIETPPRLPQQDELEALIKEARQRTRQRRRRRALVAVGVVILAAGAYWLVSGTQQAVKATAHGGTSARVAPRHAAAGCFSSLGFFSALAFPDQVHGWVLASRETNAGPIGPVEILGTADAGATWTCQWRSSLAATQLVASGRRDAWVLAWQGASCGGEPSVALGCRSVIVGTDDGRHWTALDRPSQRITQLAFISRRVGLAAARSPRCAEPNSGLPPRRCSGYVLRSTDGGRNWREVLKTFDPITAVASSGHTMWAVETRLGLADPSKPNRHPGLAVLVSHDGGRAWSAIGRIGLWLAGLREEVQLVPGRSGQLWLSVLDPDGCAMHGCSPDSVYVSSSSGRHWHADEPIDARDGIPGYSGCGLSGPLGLAVDPSGGAWANAEIPLAACTGPAAVLFHSPPLGAGGSAAWQVTHRWPAFQPSAQAWPTSSIGYALGSTGETGTPGLSRSTNGGRTWTQVLPAPEPAGPIQATSARTAYAAGDNTDQGAVLGTADGGLHWNVLARLPGLVTAVDFSAPGTGFASGAVWSPRSGPRWRLYSTASRPSHWRRLADLPLRSGQQVSSLWMSRSGQGLMAVSSGFIWPQLQPGVGPVRLWETDDAGRTWRPVARLLGRLTQIFGGASFVPAGAGRWDGWLLSGAGELQATTDTASTWQVLNGAPTFEGIDRVNASFGVAWNGPRNSRLALWQTADGGHHWRAMELPAGLVQGRISNQLPVDASFLNQATGWLIANGSTWRTTDGGRSWRQAQVFFSG